MRQIQTWRLLFRYQLTCACRGSARLTHCHYPTLFYCCSRLFRLHGCLFCLGLRQCVPRRNAAPQYDGDALAAISSSCWSAAATSYNTSSPTASRRPWRCIWHGKGWRCVVQPRQSLGLLHLGDCESALRFACVLPACRARVDRSRRHEQAACCRSDADLPVSTTSHRACLPPFIAALQLALPRWVSCTRLRS